MGHGGSSASLLQSPSPGELADALAIDEHGDTQKSEKASQGGICAKGAVIASCVDELGNTKAHAKADKTAEGRNDDEDWTRSCRVGI